MFGDIDFKAEVVNGKISYIPHINSPEQVKFEAPKNG